MYVPVGTGVPDVHSLRATLAHFNSATQPPTSKTLNDQPDMINRMTEPHIAYDTACQMLMSWHIMQ